MPFWADTHVLGMLRERNRDVTGIGRGTLLLDPLLEAGEKTTSDAGHVNLKIGKIDIPVV